MYRSRRGRRACDEALVDMRRLWVEGTYVEGDVPVEAVSKVPGPWSVVHGYERVQRAEAAIVKWSCLCDRQPGCIAPARHRARLLLAKLFVMFQLLYRISIRPWSQAVAVLLTWHCMGPSRLWGYRKGIGLPWTNCRNHTLMTMSKEHPVLPAGVNFYRCQERTLHQPLYRPMRSGGGNSSMISGCCCNHCLTVVTLSDRYVPSKKLS